MASSSLRMLRLAMARPEEYASNASIAALSLQSEMLDGVQDADKGDRDDPERQRAPAILASFDPAEGGDGFRRQHHAVADHALQMLQDVERAPGDRGQAGCDAPEFARARHRALDAADGAEIALDPFAHHGVGDLPDVELRIETPRHAFDHHHGLL